MHIILNVKARQLRRGICIREERFHNDIVLEGKTLLLNTMFYGAAANSWFIGLIDEDGFTIISPTDTMSVHAGWDEWTAYDDSTRPEWIVAEAIDGAIWSAPLSPAVYVMSAAGTLKGVFLCSDDTKGGSTGFLWATALFSDSNLAEDWDVEIDDEIQLSYGVLVG